PAPRPAPRPAPAPAPAPVIEVAPPVIEDVATYNAPLSSPKFTQPLLDTPRTVQVIPEKLMKDQGVTTLRDALRNVSGLSVTAGEGGTTPGDNFNLRGFSARNDMFVDGIRDFGSHSRDPFNLEQVEVVKGPSSSQSGRGATGGSINLVSKQAKLNDFLNTDISVGTDNLRRGTLDYNTKLPIEGAALRLNVMGHENDVPGRDYVTRKRWGVAGSLGFGLGEVVAPVPSGKSTYDKNGWSGKESVAASVVPNDTRLFIDYFHMEEDNMPDNGLPWVANANPADPRLRGRLDRIAPVPYSNFYGNVGRDMEETSTTTTTLRFEHDFNDGLTFRNQTRVGESSRYNIIMSPRINYAVNPARMTNDNKTRDEENSIFTNQSDLIFSFDTGGLHHDGVLGYEYSREEFNTRAFNVRGVVLTNQLFAPNPFLPLLAAGAVGPTGASTHTVGTTNAVYLFDTVEVTDWLEVNGGIRHDRYDTEYTGIPAPGPGAVTKKLGRTDEVTSGQAGVVFKPVENGSIYFGWGTSFNPSGEALSLNDTATATNNINIGPETSETLELGTKWNLFEDKLSLSAGVFQITKNNARTEDPNNPNDFIVLQGEQEVRGFEFGLSGSITPWWQVYTAYTHLDSEITKSLNRAEIGKELANTPANTFSLWNNFDLPGKFIAGGGPTFVDSRYTSNANTRMAESYVTWDAMVGYEINDNLTFRVNFLNIGDERYLERLSGGHAVPGAGRSVMFTISGQF
ncbi:MAG TPA: TonB-dependent siderophore receptor, partial [Bacteroidia bacterium]|nr:TonB-dependent siderophore receptor [Bacteroidia bacterium]